MVRIAVGQRIGDGFFRLLAIDTDAGELVGCSRIYWTKVEALDAFVSGEQPVKGMDELVGASLAAYEVIV